MTGKFVLAASICLIARVYAAENAKTVYSEDQNYDEPDVDVTFAPVRTTVGQVASYNSRFAWKFDRWSPCFATGCQDGRQHRKVWCATNGQPTVEAEVEVDSSYCATFPRPSATQACVNVEVCLQQANRVTWRVGVWSACTVRMIDAGDPNDPPCDKSVAERVRTVDCVVISTNETLPDEICNRVWTVKPPSRESCPFNCSRDCVTTPFGPWSSCIRRVGNSSCLNKIQYRTKQILVQPLRGKPCGAILERRLCSRDRYKNLAIASSLQVCDDVALSAKYLFKASSWSDCASDAEELASEYSDPTDRGSLRTSSRKLSCVDESGAATDVDSCIYYADGANPVTSRICLAQQCPKPSATAVIVTLPASTLTFTAERCADARTLLSGSVEKQLSLESINSRNGQCRITGNTTPLFATENDVSTGNEHLTAEQCARLFAWKVTRYGPCELQSASSIVNCGYGFKRREVLCINITGNQPQQVDDKYCSFFTKPIGVEVCTVPCRSNCAMSVWSPWSECLPAVCSSDSDDDLPPSPSAVGHRVRTRSVLVQPTDDASPCQHLAEFQRCSVQPCFRWKVVQRSKQCVLPQSKPCGTGKRLLKEVCVNHLQVPVNSSLCAEKLPAGKETCEVPCVNDCVVSDWSDWSKCMEGERMRYRTVVKAARANGTACPSSLQERERCEDVPVTYRWQTNIWGVCQPNDGRCGAGRQTRRVQCVDDREQPVDIENCAASSSGSLGISVPPARRDCVVPCPIECPSQPPTCPSTSTSTSTSTSALPWCPRLQREIGFELIDHRKDTRDVASFLVADGETQVARCTRPNSTSCSTTTPRDSNQNKQCLKYFWYTRGWSECRLGPDATCGAGMRVRNFDCVLLPTSPHNNDYDVHVGVIETAVRDHSDKLVPAQRCIDAHGPLPATTELMECQVPCAPAPPGQCEYSPWSIWTPCTSGCVPSTRQRRVVTRGECNNLQPTFETRECPHCRRGTMLKAVEVGDWSDCILPQNAKCGLGARYRKLICMDSDGNEVANVNCSASQLARQPCYVPCVTASHCDYTEWSSWSRCSVSCFNPKQFNLFQQIVRYQNDSFDFAFAGYQTREMVSSSDDPSCPERSEARFCEPNVECNDYRWLSTEWSACALLRNDTSSSGTQCGMGVRSRNVKCYEYRGSTILGEVDDMSCNQTKPTEQEFCELACHNECVMTQWTAWSRCSTPCSPSQYRHRSRSVLVNPLAVADDGDNCPHKDESQPCELGKACFEYSWRVKSRSPCVPISLTVATDSGHESQQISNDGTICGPGLKKIDLECVANGEKPVEFGWCFNSIGMPNQSLVERCEIPCATDCIVSPWSSWSDCKHAEVGTGYRSRRRSVLLRSAGAGRPCPASLEQNIACSYTYSYRWEFTKWSDCLVELAPVDSSCGEGIRRRTIFCQRNGTRVSDVYCELAALPRPADYLLTENCYKSCPSDCDVTEWSPWSACNKLCSQGLSSGIQTRSREIVQQSLSSLARQCPDRNDLIETRPCSDGPCLKYHWVVAEGGAGEYAVWCQRNDGQIVEGGCTKPRPGRLRPCRQCPVDNSVCMESEGPAGMATNVQCICRSAYIPRKENSKLVECIANLTALAELEAATNLYLDTEYSADDWALDNALSYSPKGENPTISPVFGGILSASTTWYLMLGAGALLASILAIGSIAFLNYSRRRKNIRNRRHANGGSSCTRTRTSTTSIDNQLNLLASQKSLDLHTNCSSPSGATALRSVNGKNGVYAEMEPLTAHMNTFSRC